MEIGIDSFASRLVAGSPPLAGAEALAQFVARIELADQVGLDVFGVGEHHRPEFLDSAPTHILAAARTRRIRSEWSVW